jgi:hypothetical protein
MRSHGAMRTFIDASGTAWRVWAVHPQAAERRATRERRRGSDGDDERPRERLLDRLRRRGRERRLGVDRRGRVRAGALARAAFGGGWLCFEVVPVAPSPDGGASAERRRLAPAPLGWAAADDARLAAYCRLAGPPRLTAAQRRGGRGDD